MLFVRVGWCCLLRVVRWLSFLVCFCCVLLGIACFWCIAFCVGCLPFVGWRVVRCLSCVDWCCSLLFVVRFFFLVGLRLLFVESCVSLVVVDCCRMLLFVVLLCLLFVVRVWCLLLCFVVVVY